MKESWMVTVVTGEDEGDGLASAKETYHTFWSS